MSKFMLGNVHSLVVLLVTTISICCGSQAEAQNNFSGYYSPYYQNMGFNYGNQYSQQKLLWNDRTFQKKLDLTRAQRRDLSEIKIDYEDAIEELQQESKDLMAKRYTRSENGAYQVNKEVQEKINQVNARIKDVTNDFVGRANKILLPHQRETQKQMNFSRIISQGFIKQLTAGQLDPYLDLSPEQKKKLNQVKKELDKKMRESIAEIMDEIKEALIDELDPQQKKKAREIIKEYEYRNNRAAFSLLQYESYFFKKKKNN